MCSSQNAKAKCKTKRWQKSMCSINLSCSHIWAVFMLDYTATVNDACAIFSTSLSNHLSSYDRILQHLKRRSKPNNFSNRSKVTMLRICLL
jgi:hypothetical protein